MGKDSYNTFRKWEEALGEDIANRAEVLAAMDCLIHHLDLDEDGKSDIVRWKSVVIPDERNWNLLDWEPGVASDRTMDYMKLAKGMDSFSFECICRIFADIIRGQCFRNIYMFGRFR